MTKTLTHPRTPTMAALHRLRDTARAVARETGWQRPPGYGLGPVGRSRDSDILEVSNFETILADLTGIDDRVTVARFGHWAVGWVEEILCPLTPAIGERVAYWTGRLADYPVADEDDYSRREQEAIADAWDAWAGYDVRRTIADILRALPLVGEDDAALEREIAHREDRIGAALEDDAALEREFMRRSWEADESPYCDSGGANFPAFDATCQDMAAGIAGRWAHEDARAADPRHRCAECDAERERAGQSTLGLIA